MTPLGLVSLVGKGRSGSTLVGDVLGSFPGVFHMGELWRLWSHCLLGGHSCSCGLRVVACPVWSPVLERVSASDAAWSMEHPAAVVSLQRDLFSFGGMAKAGLAGRYSRSRDTYLELIAQVLRDVSEVTGAGTLVDGSKWPLDPVLLDSPTGIDPIPVHVVRDPRAVAVSWSKTKIFPDTGAEMPRFGALHTALSWHSRALAAEWVIRRPESAGLSMRLEDFLVDPSREIGRIGRRIGSDWALEPGPGHTLHIQPGHTLMGNPSRFDSGDIVLRPDTGNPRSPVVAVATWPLRRRFGY